LKKLLRAIESSPHFVDDLKPEPWGGEHNPAGPVIFSVAMNWFRPLDSKYDAQMFVGTARQSGYTGDIVLGLSPGYSGGFLEVIKDSGCVVYTVETACAEELYHEVCSFKGRPDMKASVNVIRYYLYQYWAALYNSNAMIMIADFRDVLFQSNPFIFETKLWMPATGTATATAQLVVFQEAYPNKVINRCPFNSGWIRSCYGQDAIERIGYNTVSCSGVTIGTRDAMLVYTWLITQQLDPKVRGGSRTNKECLSIGVDQGFHNYLVYSGILDRYMDVKISPQGQGPVNTLGAFFNGTYTMLRFDLKTWQVLRGEGKNKYISNWDGKPSPVVHQYDRFADTDLSPHVRAHLAAVQKLDF
jgi:hypothetical protein